MQRKTAHGETCFLIDPAQLAMQLANNIRLETGLLSSDTIYISQEGVQQVVVEHRPRQKTAITLEGSDEVIRVPMPNMLLFRRTSEQGTAQYRIYAVKERPKSLSASLYHVPTPNVYGDGRICWGSVQQPKGDELKNTSLKGAFKAFFGTPFGGHSVSSKSESHPQDIRHKYLDMVKRRTRVYPKRDLVKARRTVQDVIEELSK